MLLLLLSAGFALRLVAALQQNDWLRAEFPGSWPEAIATLSHDGNTYLRQARNGLFADEGPEEQRWYRKPYYRPPGASLYFDAALNATRFEPTAFFAVQAALAVAACALSFLLAREWFPPWVARLGLVVVLFHPVLIFYDASLEDSVPACFLLSLGLLAFGRHLRRGVPASLLLAGVALALSVSVRPNFLVFPAVLAPMIPRHGAGWRRLLRPLLFLLPVAALLAFTARQNTIAGGGRFSGLLVATIGENLFWGNNAHPSYRISFLPRKGAESPAHYLMETLRERHGGETADETYLRAAVAYFREDPRGAALGLLRKAGRHLSNWEIPRNLNFPYSRDSSPVFRLPYLPYGILAGLFFLGVADALAGRRGTLFLAAPFVCAVVTEMVFFNASRYRSIAIPFMIPFALAGGARMFESYSRREWPRLLGAAALLSACAAAGALTVSGSERRSYLSAEHNKAALVALRWEDKWSHLWAADALDGDSIEVFDSIQYHLIESGNALQALEMRKSRLPTCVSFDPVCAKVADSLLRRARSRLTAVGSPGYRGGGAGRP